MTGAQARVGPAPAVLLVTGAGLGAWAGYLHLHLWSDGYRHIHVIGPLFLFQAVAGELLAGAVLVAAALRLDRVLVAGSALASALLLLLTAGGLLTSDWFGLFGLHDHLDAPYAGLSLTVELTGAAILVSATVLVGRRAQRP